MCVCVCAQAIGNNCNQRSKSASRRPWWVSILLLTETEDPKQEETEDRKPEKTNDRWVSSVSIFVSDFDGEDEKTKQKKRKWKKKTYPPKLTRVIKPPLIIGNQNSHLRIGSSFFLLF